MTSPGDSSRSGSPRKPSSFPEMTPSALAPISTSTSSASTRTTTPSTMSPCFGVPNASSSARRKSSMVIAENSFSSVMTALASSDKLNGPPSKYWYGLGRHSAAAKTMPHDTKGGTHSPHQNSRHRETASGPGAE